MARFRPFARPLAYVVLIAVAPLALAGCISFSSSDPSPPPNTHTIVVPAGTTVICNPSPCPGQ